MSNEQRRVYLNASRNCGGFIKIQHACPRSLPANTGRAHARRKYSGRTPRAKHVFLGNVNKQRRENCYCLMHKWVLKNHEACNAALPHIRSNRYSTKFMIAMAFGCSELKLLLPMTRREAWEAPLKNQHFCALLSGLNENLKSSLFY